MSHKHVTGPNGPPEREPQREDGAGTGANPPGRERRSRHRVADDQKSGQGALSALSRMQMMERRRAALEPEPGDPKPSELDK